MKTIIAIVRQDVWEQSQKTGEYSQSTIDTTLADVGFIHCSFPDQTLEIVNRHFADRDNLVLLFIDQDKVKSPVKYEGALSGRAGTFPHIHGPLNVDAVYSAVSLQKSDKGEFIAPDELQEAQHMNDFSDVVKVMANTPPVSNEELKRHKD
jgi:uncharacterized protein (DUF952 family)